MKRITKVTILILAFLLFTQSALLVQAKGSSKKPDPNFKDKAIYIENSHLPYYGKNSTVDIYVADNIFYSVDAVTQEIVEIEPEVIDYQIDATYTEEQLQKMAETMIADFIGDKVKLDKLSYSLGQKTGTYFFRWEDIDKKLDNGNHPFIQVGFSQNGDFLNLVNSLPFGKKFASLQAPKVYTMPAQKSHLIGPFNEIYANGGSYWTPIWSYSSATGGYYYLYPSGCSGTFCSKFYYTTTNACGAGCITGTWTPRSNTNTRAAVFVPSTHATAYATYTILRNTNTSFTYSFDQNAYYNSWKLITTTTVSAGIRNVSLRNYGTAGYEVAWDELWVYNP